MKFTTKIIAGAAALLLFGGAAVAGFHAAANQHPAYANVKGIVGSDTELKSVWVPTVKNLAYPSKKGLTEVQLKAEADKVLDNSKDLGFNAVFFQVRPSADALYKSNLFPWSALVSGTQGVAPDGGFDPLQYFIDGAHSRGMELHAWINPYRITADAKENGTLAANNPALLHPELAVKHSDGKMYFNPGEPEARKLVIDGISEIVDNYDVDGIHFDDYFYPGADFADQATFAKYGAGYANLADFRRGSNDTLVRDVQSTLKNKGKNVAFGVSPFGIWANKSTSSLGSDTKGSESYKLHYADTRKWVKEGYVDYIMPQLYWEAGHPAADYNTLADWWADVANGTNVKLYIGLGAHKSNRAETASSPWYGGKEITRQLEYNRANSTIKGYGVYGYHSIVSNANLYGVIKAGNGAGGQTSTPGTGQMVDAVVSEINITVDGAPVRAAAYNIGGNNYFKLRDIAFAVKDSDKKFEVSWNQDTQVINLEKGKSYTPVGAEMTPGTAGGSATGTESKAEIYLDGTKIQVAAYTINDNNYFKLRDLGETFNFATDWNNDTRTLSINTAEAYKPE